MTAARSSHRCEDRQVAARSSWQLTSALGTSTSAKCRPLGVCWARPLPSISVLPGTAADAD